MRTNKFLLIALATAGMFTACSNDDEVVMNQGNEISFRVQGGAPSLRTTASTINNVDAFVVYGTDDVHNSTAKPNLPFLIFDGVTVARDIRQSGDIFTYAPTKYYDVGATEAAFVAFSPVSAKFDHAKTDITNFMTGSNTIEFEYTVPRPGEHGPGLTAQEDLLIAKAVVTGTPISSSTVHLKFEHALSRIFVTAINKTADPVIIKSLTLKNLENTGTLTFNADAGYNWSWAPASSSSLRDYEYILADSGVVVTPALLETKPMFVTTMEQGMMVLPQRTANTALLNEFDTDDFALEVVYTFANHGTQTRHILLQDGYRFNEKSQYTINIEFIGTSIDFTIEVDDFGAIQPVTPTYP